LRANWYHSHTYFLRSTWRVLKAFKQVIFLFMNKIVVFASLIFLACKKTKPFER